MTSLILRPALCRSLLKLRSQPIRRLLTSNHHPAKFPRPSTSLSHVPTRHLQHSADPIQPAHRATDFAFALDIDGVLLRSGAPLPGAIPTLKFLSRHSIPFLLLTNGGGNLESARVAELSATLNVPITEQNFVQSHTPFKDFAAAAAGTSNAVLVTGTSQESVRKVAHSYGFANAGVAVVTPGDIRASDPAIWPFEWGRNATFYRRKARPLPSPDCKVGGIFIFSDPNDWALDTQIILDLLLSEQGVLGTYSAKNGRKELPNRGYLQDGQPKLYFSNPDLFWAAGYKLPRLGQGGFRSSLQGVWNAVTDGAELPMTVIGKPSELTYRYAEDVLHSAPLNRVLKTVYMIGDNPESDIRGANQYQSRRETKWESVLVKTGVWKEDREPTYKPTAIVEDVRDAVMYGLRKQGYEFDKAEFEDAAH